METTQLDRNVVKQHNDIIGGKYNLNPNEIKFILTIVAQIKMEDEDFKPYTITKKELEERWGVELNEARLKEFADGILSKPFHIKRPPPEGSKKKSGGFIVMNWFSSIEYKEHQAVIEASFDPKLMPYLLDLKGTFTTYNLGYALKFKSAYAIRIYQLIKQFEPKGYYRTKVSELQEILKVPDSLKVYANFKNKVLLVALKEINQHSDLQVVLVEHKTGRKVTEIEYKIKKVQVEFSAFVGQRIMALSGSLETIIECYRDSSSGQIVVRTNESNGLYEMSENSFWNKIKEAKKTLF